jgi:hypothetical protein
MDPPPLENRHNGHLGVLRGLPSLPAVVIQVKQAGVRKQVGQVPPLWLLGLFRVEQAHGGGLHSFRTISPVLNWEESAVPILFWNAMLDDWMALTVW